MGEVIWIMIVMLIIAALAFAPLGYFIYQFTQKKAEPFGDTEPHGDSPSAINDLAESAIRFAQGLLGKK